jgi:hypothetical protein
MKRRGKKYYHRKYLWDKNPYCHYCNELTIFRDFPSNGILNDDDATIEHLWSRFDERRIKGITSPKVIACYKCNHERGIIEDIKHRDGNCRKAAPIVINKSVFKNPEIWHGDLEPSLDI